MARAPRPIVIRFYVGKGLGVARQESANTSRVIVQQVALSYAEESFDEFKKELSATIKRDAEAELTHMARLYRKYIIGTSGYKSGPSGTLTALAKGPPSPPSRSLASLTPPWVPRSTSYLQRKKAGGAGVKWFDNSGWNTGGYLKAAFQPERLWGGVFGDGGGIFSDMFGGISVEIIRNLKGTGTLSGGLAGRGTAVNTQLATIRVRALGKITNSMLNATTSAGNPALIGLVEAYDEQMAARLGGPKGRYRPTLEPFLKFYLQQSLPHAVSARVAKGTQGTLFRTS